MASISSYVSNSHYCPRWKYDVFLSFRGEDTRDTIAGYLYERLTRRGIITFQDNKRLEHGDSIPKELSKAIKDSQVALVIFSKNYATSRWCLDELVKIMECANEENEKTIIPVFYGVDATDVRYQSKSFAETFAKHELKYKDDDEGMQKVQRWRTALTVAANLKGYVFPNGVESDCIERIVDDISSKCKTSVSYSHKVVGIDTQIEKVESLLEMEIDDVRIVWICGMGGVGKTTIANAIYNKLSSSKFKDACFLEDIKENKHRMYSLQNILLSKLLGEKENCVNNKEEGRSLMARRFQFKKVLLVLDDIDHRDQLDYLAGDLCWFGKGSRIIATTRDKRLIRNSVLHEVETLLDRDAIKLFNQYAFMENVPDECFENLTLEIVSHAKGHPLALKVWGSLLYKKDIIVWRSALDRIRENSGSEIIENLKISYDGLEPNEQEIFLDIACFFRGKEKEKVMQILESCDFPAEYGLSVLIDKSLVFISDHNKIQMHDLIQDMGQYIVKMQKHPGERSRLWKTEDVKEVMVDYQGTMAVEGICFTFIQKLCFSKEAMNNMKRLRILHICSFISPIDREDVLHDSNCHDGSIEYLPNNLCWFVWHEFPWKSLPENFEPQRLVHLDLKWSSLHDLWTERKVFLPSLQKLDLSCSKSLIQTPDFTGMPNLEYLNLRRCTSLKEVHHSLGCSKKLIELDLYHCEKLERFPRVNVESVKSLDLVGCSSLEKFPEFLGKMKLELEIRMRFTWIRELPSSIIQHQARLRVLDLSDMKSLVALPSSVCKLKVLMKLDVSYCSKLESLPEEIGDLENLEELHASHTLISRPPSSIIRLNKLKFLTFAKKESEDGVYFVFPQVNEGLHSLEILNLGCCNIIDGGLPEDIGCLRSLKRLYLGRNNFHHLPRSIAQLGSLRSLNLSHCKKLKQLPEFPEQLDTIYADWSKSSICNSLFQNISSSQHDISASDSLSLRLFTSRTLTIPTWFHRRGTGKSGLVNLPENWYVADNFLGFAICYTGRLMYVTMTTHLIPLCYDSKLWMTLRLDLLEPDSSSLVCEYSPDSVIHFFFVPFAGLWDTSKANGKTPNDYGRIILSFSGDIRDYGFRLLYKNLCIRTRKSKYDDSTVTNEASCSSSKKQRSHF
ncbi:TMV resistance protein N-like [Solanum stenotomum]|uniref:TMV resistance protein N-like n=1 Tax=Solanum stenotomum TaxID=172797 RepID=UPI0020D11FD6|nr:TMV resistance protein N-like [Solanum stenotomum]